MTNVMNQKSAVYASILNVLAENNISFDDGQDVSLVLTKEMRATVNAVLVEGFNNKTIELDKVYDSEAKLKSYVSGLISNWIKKDKRLNGNTKHEAKNPGSRFGSSDAQLKALTNLKSTMTDPTEIAEIDGYIATRKAELSAAKPKTVKVNIEDLPEALRQKYSA